MAKAKHIVMVGDDGNVYHIQPGDLKKVAKKVPRDSLSYDVRSHIDATTGSGKGEGGGVAHIFASKADIFVASKADIFVAGEQDILVSSKADIFVAGKD